MILSAWQEARQKSDKTYQLRYHYVWSNIATNDTERKRDRAASVYLLLEFS